MGSMDAACISGFLCRLCSEMHRTVIHIYGDQGHKHKLASKINDYLPVTITPNDPLPKTICKSCMARVEQHHSLMTTMAKNQTIFALRHRQAQSTARAAANQSENLTISRNTATTAASAIVVAAVSAAAREAERRINSISENSEISTNISERSEEVGTGITASGMHSIVSRLYDAVNAITELDTDMEDTTSADNSQPDSATAT